MKFWQKVENCATILAATCVVSLVVGFAVGRGIQNTELKQRHDEAILEAIDLRKQVKETKMWSQLTEDQQYDIEEGLKDGSLEIKNSHDINVREMAANARRETDLSPGNYTCGKMTEGDDFRDGKYDIVAISGRGNIICEGVINEILHADGTEKSNTYNNVTFSKGDVLEVSGSLKVKLIPS